MTLPYNDEQMIFRDGMYYLTEKALNFMGIDIRARLSESNAISPEYTINMILETVSNAIYGYIHEFNNDNNAQDRMIATVPSLRRIIKLALEQQAYYLLSLGDQAMTLDDDKIKHMVSPHAKQTLNRTIPELGVPITYIGGI